MGYVYILQSGNEHLFKIGMTRGDVDDRVKGLSTGNPHLLSEYASIATEHPSKVESFLQGLLRSKRSRRSDATEFYAVSSGELDVAIEQAREYAEHDLAREAEVDRLASERCDDRLITPQDEDWKTYEGLLLARETHDAAALARNRLEWKLKLRIGTAYGLDGLATWRTIPQKRFDEKAFASQHPELYSSFKKATYPRRFDLL